MTLEFMVSTLPHCLLEVLTFMYIQLWKITKFKSVKQLMELIHSIGQKKKKTSQNVTKKKFPIWHFTH